jgi:hypothetical protein
LDITINSVTAGEDILFDAGGKTVTFDNIDIIMSDDDVINFGDSSETSLQYDEDGFNALQVSGAMFGAYRVVENHTANDTLTAAESGSVHLVQLGSSGGSGASDFVLTLPPAAAGIEFYIVDANETVAADVTITAGAGDKIDNGSAAASIVHDTDADNWASVHLLAIDATEWIILHSSGTWTAE